MDTTTLQTSIPSSSPPFPSDGEADLVEELSPAEVLAGLQRPGLSADRRRRLILTAELLPFDGEQEEQLKPLLRQYIDRYASVDPPEEQVGLASAIRKYVAMLGVSELSVVEELLRPERKVMPPLEMEVLKMITRKLTATLPEDTSGQQSLGEQLVDVARSYLNPRILARRYFGPATLDACLSLALLRNPRLAEVVDLVRSVKAPALRLIIAREARRLSTNIDARFAADRSAPARAALAALAAAAEAAQL